MHKCILSQVWVFRTCLTDFEPLLGTPAHVNMRMKKVHMN